MFTNYFVSASKPMSAWGTHGPITKSLLLNDRKINDTPKESDMLNYARADGPPREPRYGAVVERRSGHRSLRVDCRRTGALRCGRQSQSPQYRYHRQWHAGRNISRPMRRASRTTSSPTTTSPRPAWCLTTAARAVQTQLGGVIAGNSQLGAKPAKVILNEVIGANPTMLNGTTEIAGKSAHLIVANPNGITVNGGGFINAPRTTLTTGKATFDSLGNIANIDTTRGRIEIQGKGLDATRIDQLDLIARSIAVNAALHAEGAKVVGVGGVTRHNLKSGTTQMAVEAGLKGEGSAPRTVAVDVSSLGSMYANSIRLVGSPEGLGVNGHDGPGPISARSMPE